MPQLSWAKVPLSKASLLIQQIGMVPSQEVQPHPETRQEISVYNSSSVFLGCHLNLFSPIHSKIWAVDFKGTSPLLFIFPLLC